MAIFHNKFLDAFFVRSLYKQCVSALRVPPVRVSTSGPLTVAWYARTRRRCE